MILSSLGGSAKARVVRDQGDAAEAARQVLAEEGQQSNWRRRPRPLRRSIDSSMCHLLRATVLIRGAVLDMGMDIGIGMDPSPSEGVTEGRGDDLARVRAGARFASQWQGGKAGEEGEDGEGEGEGGKEGGRHFTRTALSIVYSPPWRGGGKDKKRRAEDEARLSAVRDAVLSVVPIANGDGSSGGSSGSIRGSSGSCGGGSQADSLAVAGCCTHVMASSWECDQEGEPHETEVVEHFLGKGRPVLCDSRSVYGSGGGGGAVRAEIAAEKGAVEPQVTTHILFLLAGPSAASPWYSFPGHNVHVVVPFTTEERGCSQLAQLESLSHSPVGTPVHVIHVGEARGAGSGGGGRETSGSAGVGNGKGQGRREGKSSKGGSGKGEGTGGGKGSGNDIQRGDRGEEIPAGGGVAPGSHFLDLSVPRAVGKGTGARGTGAQSSSKALKGKGRSGSGNAIVSKGKRGGGGAFLKGGADSKPKVAAVVVRSPRKPARAPRMGGVYVPPRRRGGTSRGDDEAASEAD